VEFLTVTVNGTNTDKSVDVEFQRCVVALFGVVEVNEEEDIRPDVVFVVDVVFKTLKHTRANI